MFQDVGAKAKDFGHLSGKYSMDLIVGDSVIQNPFSWTLADVKLSFPEGAASDKSDENRYSKKPEIKVGALCSLVVFYHGRRIPFNVFVFTSVFCTDMMF